MNKEVALANDILKKYNIELRYAKSRLDEPSTAELVVLDRNKDFHIGLIRLLQEDVLKFYVGSLSFYSCDFNLSKKIREKIFTLYQDIDTLNQLELSPIN